MGNALPGIQESLQALKKRASVDSEPEGMEEDLLLWELGELDEVELWRVHQCLSHDLLPNFPPIPSHWLQSADAPSTAKILQKCYHKDGALMILDAALVRLGRHDWICSQPKHITPPKPRLATNPDLDFVKTQRRKLISRIRCLDSILDTLQDYEILNTANREASDIYGVQKERNRALVDLILTKGDKAQEVFYKCLSKSDPFLLQELEDDPIMHKNASETSLLTEMLDFLVSDELRSFQWLVSGLETTGESSTPIGGEQLHDTDRWTTQRLLEKHFGPKQAESVAISILLKIVPTIGVCLQGASVTPQRSSDMRLKTDIDTTTVEITPEVFEGGNMFRLRCQRPGVFRCSLTGLVLEGDGEVVYEMVPWDVKFLSSKGLRPAGPLFRFTLLKGSFHRLHLPHCQLLSGGDQNSLSVAHVTQDRVEFITPDQLTEGHVIINISSFCCFGLVTSAPGNSAIHAIVLLFHELSKQSLFVVLLPRNVCLTQVMNDWKQRIRGERIEMIPDCELVPNETYKLSGQPVTLIQPAESKFLNFSDYSNSLPSFHVKLMPDVRTVDLQLSHVIPLRLIDWLFGSNDCVVWQQIVNLPAATSTLSAEACVSGSENVTLLLLNTLNSVGSEDLKTFKHLLSLQSDPIPICRLEEADRTRTVDLMVQQYHSEVATHITVEILRKMNFKQLADNLHRKQLVI